MNTRSDGNIPNFPSVGIQIFAQERSRQVFVEGYDLKHDTEHGPSELVSAGYCYVQQALFDIQGVEGDTPPFDWPWDAEAWKPREGDVIYNLAKGAALLAAAVDQWEMTQSVPVSDDDEPFL